MDLSTPNKRQKMTLVKMTESRKGCEDGFVIKQFYVGQIYDVRENTARGFFAAGHAVKPKLSEAKQWVKNKEVANV